MRDRLRTIQNLVVKVGTSCLLDQRGLLDLPVIAGHLRDLVALHRAGKRVVLVSSGAIGAGRVRLGFDRRPDTIPELQATAAVGQSILMNTYNTLLAQEGYVVAQLLLTHEDFRHRHRYLNVRNTLAALHDKPALAVINENDTVAVDEIRFGDNDALAALVAGLVDADLTVLLTDVDGFYQGGRRLDVVSDITPDLEAAAGPGSGSGGMVSKLRAAASVTRAGGHAVIAHGKRHRVPEILEGAPVGTLFVPRGDLGPRARWLQGLREEGRIGIDGGGEKALRDNGGSLLAVGVTWCEGAFEAGDAVLVVGASGPVAKGLVNYAAADLDRIKGLKTAEIVGVLGRREFDEVIHRDHLLLL